MYNLLIGLDSENMVRLQSRSGGHHAVSPTPKGESVAEAFFIARQNMKTCTVEGCSGKYLAKGLCQKHYLRNYRYGDVTAIMPHVSEATFLKRFEKNFTKKDGCWIWEGTIFPRGYGRASKGKKKYRAHRLSYEFYVGKIPEGLHVLHKCDVPLCVNPDHLFLGTHLDNMRDMERKGRAKWIQENLKRKASHVN